MKVVIQHNIVLHARVIVPFASAEVAAQILRERGWLIEKSGPNTQRLRPDYDNVEFVVSRPFALDLSLQEKWTHIGQLEAALEEA
jgi:hypothetical protein